MRIGIATDHGGFGLRGYADLGPIFTGPRLCLSALVFHALMQL